MFHIYFLNLFNDTMIAQTQNLEKVIDFKMHVGYRNVSEEEMNNQIRWAEREKMDAIICELEDYDKIMHHRPMMPVYPVRNTAFDTCLILYLLKKHLKEVGLSHYRKVILGTYLPINVSIDILEEMYDFKLLNPPWADELNQSYFDAYAREGYQVVVCAPGHHEKIRNSGMYPFYDDSVAKYIDFSQDIKQAIQQVATGNQLQRTLDELRNMLNYSFEAICILDNDGRVTNYNKKMTDVFPTGGSREYASRYFYELVPAVTKEEIDDILKKGKSYYSRIVDVKNLVGMLNITPNYTGEVIDGAVVHFTTVQQIERMETQVNNEIYQKGHYAKYRFEDILGESESITKTKKLAERFSKYHSNILLYGESGCGKELFAQSIHNSSLRSEQPFVAINCGSLPTNLLESELFGYVEGAFTGAAKKGKKGLFEIANKGTIFLDEISEIDAQGQIRLLRVLEERTVMRVGDDKVVPVDVRVIAASNKNLLRLVKEGRFREDLYYRLNVLTLNIPPLRKRGNDIVLLAENFIKKYGMRYNKYILLSTEAEQELLYYSWRGNVRQLRNFCERLVIVADDINITGTEMREQLKAVEMSSFDEKEGVVTEEKESDRPEEDIYESIESVDNLAMAEKISIMNALKKTEGNREKTAALLGISKSTLWRKMKEYKLNE